MNSLRNFVIVNIIIITSIEEVIKIKSYNHPLLTCLSVAYFVSRILSQVIIAYKYPLLFVLFHLSWIIIQDPLVQNIIKLLYKRKNNLSKKEIN